MADLSAWKPAAFTKLCDDIVAGLGITTARVFDAKGVERSHLATIVRTSTDGASRSEETWLCAFARGQGRFDAAAIAAVAGAAISANARYCLAVMFGEVDAAGEAELRAQLGRTGIDAVLLAGTLAETLAAGHARSGSLPAPAALEGFSFARLRRHANGQVEGAPWKKEFQTQSFLPTRLAPAQRTGDDVPEADLFQAAAGGSCLILGAPGAGKTTSLRAFAGALAAAGGHSPVFVPLGAYIGDLWALLGEALSPERPALSRGPIEGLLRSGALVVLLDGINEVQDTDLHRRLVEEINALTAPEAPTANSRWIVTGRAHDYQQSYGRLDHLEARRWEIQPFTDDLVFRYLRIALGEAEGEATYKGLSRELVELCGNPLLLTMVVAVRRETGHLPAGRGALYRRFIEILLRWGEERGLGTEAREELASLWPETLTDDTFRAIAQKALTRLAGAMSATALRFSEAERHFAAALPVASDPTKAARLLIEYLTRRGLLRRDHSHRVSFFHHTAQEYFLARALDRRSPEELIPEEGVLASRRETVVFLAGMLKDPSPLVKRALKIDLALAFDLVRDAPETVPARLTREMASALWTKTVKAVRGGSVQGSTRRWARLFQQTATLLGTTVETLATEIDSAMDTIERTERLIRFYQELGDVAGQERTLAAACSGDHVPEGLLFAAAFAAKSSGDLERAIDLYTRYIDNSIVLANQAAALNNRGLAYKALGWTDLALADHQKAVKLHGLPNHWTNLGNLLVALGRSDEAIQQYKIALESDSTYPAAHYDLARVIKPTNPETALQHYESAVQYADHDEDLLDYLPSLSTLQEELGRHADAIRSLRHMISLAPTSPNVKKWKDRITRSRQALDEEIRKRSARERLMEQDDLPLPTLAAEWLHAAGMKPTVLNSAWLLAAGGGQPGSVPLVLVPEPVLTAAGLGEALRAPPAEARKAKRIMVLTAAETLSVQARHQLAAMQEGRTVALLTGLEIREAFLESDRESRRLFDQSLQRAAETRDPFVFKGVVKQHADFFGRTGDVEALSEVIRQGQQVGLYGIHKIGKSSLLEQFRRKLHLAHPEINAVPIELNAGMKEPADFYREIFGKLPGAIDLPEARVTTAAFRQALTAFHERRDKSRPGHRLLLILDEYAYLIPDRHGRGGLRGFIEVLSALKIMHQEGWLLILPCGRTAALSRQASWGKEENPFLDLLQARFLQTLSREENDALMSTLGVRAGMTFGDDGLSEIYAATGGHPGFSRDLGSQLVRTGKGRVGRPRVQQAVKAMLADRDQMAVLLAIYEERMDKDEQAIARVLALEGARPRKELLPADASIEQRRQIRDAIANMVDTTILVEQTDGKLGHRYGLLRRAIQQQAEELGL